MAKADTSNGDSWIAKIPAFLGLYLIYLFVSGWTFGDFYLRELGLSPRWLELSVYDILITGFTVLFTGGRWLWPFYLLALLVPILLETFVWGRYVWPRLASALVLFGVIFPIYFVSRAAGVQQARIDQNPASSRLPVITFSLKDGKRYVGKLLYLKNGTYFVREARDIASTNAEDKSLSITLSIYRAEDVHDVTVIGYP